MDDYAYINVRIRHLRSKLLDHKIYEELLQATGITQIRDILRYTTYERRLQNLPIDASSELLTDTFKQEWLKTIQKCVRWADGRPRIYLEGLLGRWELENIKTIIRGKNNHFGQAAILSALLPVGLLNPLALAELVRQPTIEAVLDLLFTWRSPYVGPLRKVFRDQQKLQTLELSLDIHYYQSAFSRFEKEDPNAVLVRDLMGMMIDKSNFLTAFTIFHEKRDVSLDPTSYFIKGGKELAFLCYEKIAKAQSLRDIRQAIQKTPYEGVIENDGTEKRELPISLIIERNIERLILSRIRKIEMSDPLGIGLMGGYLLRKFQEVTNLRTILQTKGYGMYSSDIRPLLVY